MTAATRDIQFATFVETERGLLQRCAFLLVGAPEPADQLVQATLADLYGRWLLLAQPRLTALRLLYTTDPDGIRLPWVPRARFELLDGGAPRPYVEPVVADLGRLPAPERFVLVLERVARLPAVDIAVVLGVSVDEVLALSRQARAQLVGARAERADDADLADELEAAVPTDLRVARTTDDLAHGRTLRRRRRARRGLAVAAALALLVVGITQLRPAPSAPVSSPVPATTVTATPTGPACDTTTRTCQATVVRAWRAQMSDVVLAHLDPEGDYFNGASYYARDETPDLWTSRQGALALELFRVDGATEVYLQIGTDRSYAPRCGQTTGNTCASTRFMDGNRFILAESSSVAQGLEAQYRPNGTDVITVIARNSGSGKSLGLKRSDLVELLQDPRLRLPEL